MAVELNHYSQGPVDAPAVVLAGALGTELETFDHLAGALADRFHVVRVDVRGHGSSPAPEGPYAMSELAEDVLLTAEDLGLDRFAFVGLSIGGAIGLTLAVEHAARLSALVVACSAPRLGTPETWQERAAAVRDDGLASLVEATRERWFTAELRRTLPELVDAVMERFAAQSPVGYTGCCAALASYDVTGRLAEVRVPTRVVVAEHDAVATPESGAALAEALPDADLVVLAGTAHLAQLGAPEAFDAAVAGHLDRVLR